jgi:N-acetylglucosamine-6-phosphate deacetylase
VQLTGRICGTEGVSRIDIDDGRITGIASVAAAPEEWPWIAPGLIDIQVNGFAGHSLNVPEVIAEDVVAIAEAQYPTGVTTFCPTVTGGSAERMTRSLRAVAEARRQGRLADRMPLIHLEGPYLSPEDGPRGAHLKEFIRPPDGDEFQRFQEAAEGLIGLVTLAPEVEGALPFIEKFVAAGIIAAIGHTNASTEIIDAAIRAGASLSTHLGNGSHALIPRHPNYIWDQLAADELWASFIVDGHHLPPAVVQCFLRCKGVERSILTTDAIQFAGQPPGRYTVAGRTVEVSEAGRVSLVGTPYLAGSCLEMYRGVANVVRFSDLTLAQALTIASTNPARLLGLADRVGQVAIGQRADLMVFDREEETCRLTVRQTIAGGEVVYEAMA